MNIPKTGRGQRAFTVLELMIIVLMVGFFFVLLLPAMGRCNCKAVRINCVNNLKQVGLSFRIWSGDNKDRFPMAVPTKEGGTMEFQAGTNMLAHFRAMSNELNTPKVLVCPAEKIRMPATNFIPDLDNNHVSYFIGLDADETAPTMLLAGDRNLTNGMALKGGMMMLTTNEPASWTKELHILNGNVVLVDGTVQQLSTARLRVAVADTGRATNRLVFP